MRELRSDVHGDREMLLCRRQHILLKGHKGLDKVRNVTNHTPAFACYFRAALDRAFQQTEVMAQGLSVRFHSGKEIVILFSQTGRRLDVRFAHGFFNRYFRFYFLYRSRLRLAKGNYRRWREIYILNFLVDVVYLEGRKEYSRRALVTDESSVLAYLQSFGGNLGVFIYNGGKVRIYYNRFVVYDFITPCLGVVFNATQGQNT